MTKLEELAEKHCFDSNYYPRTYEFTLDRLRELIKELAGEPVAWVDDAGNIWDRLDDNVLPSDNPLYKLEL